MSYFDQYSGVAAGFAAQFNVPKAYAFALFDQESGWNPNAIGDNGAAVGLGQLHAGAALDVGVNRFDPVQNIKGSLQYLSQQYQKFGNWTDAFAAYNQGAGATGAAWQRGLSYASSIFNKAEKYVNGGTVSDIANGARCFIGDPTGCAQLAGGLFSGGDQCGTFDFICKLRQWITQSSFFTRLALVTLGLLFVLGGLYLMKERS